MRICSTGTKARPRRGLAGGRDGSALAVVALVLFVMLGSVGLAIDLGRGYVEKARLGRAVDAAALAAARTLRQGEEAAETEAVTVARANRVADGVGDVETEIGFGTNERGESVVTFSASRIIPTSFMSLLGFDRMAIRSSAIAAVPPVDIVLVLDTSGSLSAAGAWNQLQEAAESFVRNFDDDLDQVGLVSFQISAHQRFMLDHDFTAPIVEDIRRMASAGDTNIGEGLRFAHLQLQAAARPSAAKVVVFFTDGRATAVRGTFGGEDRILAVYTADRSGSEVRGYFDDPDDLPPFSQADPDGCEGDATCFGLNEDEVRQAAADVGLARARALRDDDILIYTIGLGNLSYAPGDLRLPDLDYLKVIANEDGIADPDQPKGKSYFAPSANDLRAVFNEVARDLIVRLAG